MAIFCLMLLGPPAYESESAEEVREKLVKHYAEQAKEEEGAIVGFLSRSLGVVVSDLGDESLASLIDVALDTSLPFG
jgi:hypothetical protein